MIEELIQYNYCDGGKDKMVENIHSIVITEGALVEINGIESVSSATESQIKATSTKGGLIISGTGLHVEKLDLEQRLLVANGKIQSIRYTNVAKSFFKRIFK